MWIYIITIKKIKHTDISKQGRDLPENLRVREDCGGVLPLGGEPTVKMTLAGLPEPTTMVPPADGAGETERHRGLWLETVVGRAAPLTRPMVPPVAHPEPTCHVDVSYENSALAQATLKETNHNTRDFKRNSRYW